MGRQFISSERGRYGRGRFVEDEWHLPVGGEGGLQPSLRILLSLYIHVAFWLIMEKFPVEHFLIATTPITVSHEDPGQAIIDLLVGFHFILVLKPTNCLLLLSPLHFLTLLGYKEPSKIRGSIFYILGFVVLRDPYSLLLDWNPSLLR